MDRLKFTMVIDAPKEKVWRTMLDDDTYRVWTEAFMPGSHYIGEWSKGSKILFLAPGEKGELSGMVSRIKENRPYEYISIEHLGVVQDGKEDTSSEAVKQWAGALENYTFKEKDGRTELRVDLDSAEEYQEMFQDIWPKALQKLKELAEK
ncbi:MAG: SRPBCC domain-containing protein [Calditrichaceae bacterium]|nr:SRPBCC domain-containing protein [Calditrichia bacterium]NUQ43563.1 SRPBCC domain-containing protein [Calditrichaceae bacterium]